MDREEEIRQELITENENLKNEIEALKSFFLALNEKKAQMIRERGERSGIMKRKRSVSEEKKTKISK
ncbi:unnamed protein product [Blepharisma stoltei]|uniref:Transposase n=1 Tax=Blepharisma stoltei TaxID=1481888 RepID=A0AAU9IXG1_9CILI|nr:unnamed protein product [Blepharisma stoltei]